MRGSFSNDLGWKHLLFLLHFVLLISANKGRIKKASKLKCNHTFYIEENKNESRVIKNSINSFKNYEEYEFVKSIIDLYAMESDSNLTQDSIDCKTARRLNDIILLIQNSSSVFQVYTRCYRGLKIYATILKEKENFYLNDHKGKINGRLILRKRKKIFKKIRIYLKNPRRELMNLLKLECSNKKEIRNHLNRPVKKKYLKNDGDFTYMSITDMVVAKCLNETVFICDQRIKEIVTNFDQNSSN